MAAPHKRLIMAVKGGPDIITEGLVFHLDAAGASIDKGYNPNGLLIDYLVVGGGGGGGGWSTAAGGGAGGFLRSNVRLTGNTYAVIVGGGGTRGDTGSSRKGSNGGNSQFGASLVVYGGGGGGANTGDLNGLNGGSGGGGFQGNGATGIGGSGVADQGNNGGNGGGGWRSGSGGGAGAAGTPGVGGYGSARGGIGKISRIDFNREYYAGGGASGGCANGDNSGGLGGGGNGGRTNADGTNGASNLGGGGGGGGCYNTRATFGGNGGSGIVIIRYRGKQKATGGDTIVYKNGYTIHTFTSSGSFVLDESVDGLSTNKIVGSLENMGSNDYKTGNKGYFSFDGSNQAIKLPNFDVSTLGGNFTICSLIKPIGSISPVFSSVDVIPSSQTKNIAFYFQETASYGISSNAMRLQFGKDSWAWQVYGSNGLSLLKNNWYFVAVTAANLNTNTHTIKFYVNDQSVNATKWQFGSPTPINYGGDISNSTFLARSHSASDPTYINTYHEINIANVKIYNKTLSDNEVLDNYNATKGRYGL